MKKLTVCLLLVLCSCSGNNQEQNNEQQSAQQPEELRFVAWNMEHLAENNNEGCLPRDDEDYARLREFAGTLNADVVALQEVASAKAVARIFPEAEWDIVMSDRPSSEPYTCWDNGAPSTQQKVAFAVRKGVAYSDIDDYSELGLGREGLRYGVLIRITSTAEPIDVMAVHMKSGCFEDNYVTSGDEDCETFEQQAPLLDRWVESKVEASQPFLVLGDFNHRLLNGNNLFWQQLNEMDSKPVTISSSMNGIRGCHPEYPAPIDHVLMGPRTTQWQQPGSAAVHYYTQPDSSMKESDMLSDHCPVSVDLAFQ